jgi:ABC-type uncharacterized transport system substrate-binding protein
VTFALASRHALACAAFGAVGLGPVPAQAHPHIFVDTAIEVIFDAQGRAEALRISWTYDDLISLAMLSDRGMDEDFDGVLTPAELAALNGFDMGWDAGFAGDTYALLAGASLGLSGPSDWTVAYADAKITSTHLRRFEVPVVVAATPLVVQVYDPGFYTAYAILGEVALTGAAGCTAQAFEPDRAAADLILQDSIAELSGSDTEGAFPAVGAAYAEEVQVTCSAPS